MKKVVAVVSFLFVALFCGLRFYIKNTSPYFRIENLYFTASRIGYSDYRIEEGYTCELENRIYQELKGEYLGTIEKESLFPSTNLQELEGFKIEAGTEIYSINMSLAKERDVNYWGLLLETADGNIIFMVPSTFTRDKNTDVLRQVQETFYRE